MADDLKELLAALQDRKWNVRKEAIRRLETLGDTEAVPGLIEALQDESPYVRMTAARALGKLGDPAALSSLLDALDEAPIVRAARVALVDVDRAGPFNGLGDRLQACPG